MEKVMYRKVQMLGWQLASENQLSQDDYAHRNALKVGSFAFVILKANKYLSTRQSQTLKRAKE
ncbi:hypothetical protein Lal_00009278 [Lupinus albus]|nr:hypothetical protein Lal_00009278 [Lupinus albus]